MLPYSGVPAENSFISSDGLEIPYMSCIFPIMKVYGDNQIRAIGTGFFISSTGIFVTAAHVIHEWVEKDEKIHSVLVGSYFEAHKGSGTIRGIERAFLHDKADIAIGFMKQTESDNITLAYNQYLPVSFYWPRHSEVVQSISFPETIVSVPYSRDMHQYFKPQSVHGPQDQTIIFPHPLESVGQISRLYKNGRDRIFLPTACYEAQIQVYGGSSGGPVFGMNGAVIGVTNTGFDDFPVSHFTPISEILDIDINGAVHGVTGQRLNVGWLIENGFIELQADDELHPLLRTNTTGECGENPP